MEKEWSNNEHHGSNDKQVHGKHDKNQHSICKDYSIEEKKNGILEVKQRNKAHLPMENKNN
jgi:hypothetical protein